MKNEYKTIRKLIEEDNLEDAIDMLKSYLQDNKLFDEVILTSARNKNIKALIRQGVIDFKKSNIERNEIRKSLIEILNEVNFKTDSESIFSKKYKHGSLIFKHFWLKFLLFIALIILLLLFTKKETIGIKGDYNDNNFIEINE